MLQKSVRLEDLTTSLYYSSQKNPQLWDNASGQLAKRMANADKDSFFYKKFEQLYALPEPQRVATVSWMLRSGQMKEAGYDALLLHDLEGKVYGYAVFERKRDGTPHMFSLEIDEDYQKQGFGTHLSEQYVLMFMKEGKNQKARISAGNDPKVLRILEKMTSRQHLFGYQVETAENNNGEVGWITWKKPV